MEIEYLPRISAAVRCATDALIAGGSETGVAVCCGGRGDSVDWDRAGRDGLEAAFTGGSDSAFGVEAASGLTSRVVPRVAHPPKNNAADAMSGRQERFRNTTILWQDSRAKTSPRFDTRAENIVDGPRQPSDRRPRKSLTTCSATAFYGGSLSCACGACVSQFSLFSSFLVNPWVFGTAANRQLC